MTVKPVLWKHYVKKDGTCSVKLYVHHLGEEKYVSLNFSVAPADWDDRKMQVKRTHPFSVTLNGKIAKRIIEIQKALIEGQSPSDIASGNKKQGSSLLAFAEQYIDEVQRGLHDIKLSTCKNYEYCLDRLRKYAKHKGLNDLYFEDVDLDFYFSFCKYLQEHHRCNKPGISKHVKNLKKFMNEALTRGLHENTKHRNPAFRTWKKQSSNKIWLTEEEVAMLEELDLSTQPALERERDRWLVSYYFLMRYSDSVRIRKEMVFEREGTRYLRYKSQKTGFEVILPIKPKAWALMKKYNFRFDGDTNQEANRKLKIIGAMAGLVEEAAEGEKRGPKCTFLSTHTARRSAATQMYLQNVSLKVIANLGGWKRVETLKLYLLASGLETATMAKDLDFFK